jgi:hypothetical protein
LVCAEIHRSARAVRWLIIAHSASAAAAKA